VSGEGTAGSGARGGRHAAGPRPLLILLVACSGLVAGGPVATYADDAAADGPVTASLARGAWELETPLGRVAGAMLVLHDPAAGRWRAEVGLAESAPVRGEDLRHRRGRGWTLTGDAATGFIQPWAGPWREVGPEATAALTDVVVTWLAAAAPGARPRTVVLRDWHALPAAWRPPPRLPAGRGDLRRTLTRRGLGRGGPGAVLALTSAADGLRVTARRWPAELRLEGPVTSPVEVAPEAFLPLWPLADLLP
jgi:hypothetical protein